MIKMLDLFCKAGGCSEGYKRAGFDVTGVDIEPQPHYPFRFIQADAMTFDVAGYDVIHASPPCQRYSRMSAVVRKDMRNSYPDLLGPVRMKLQASGKPWIIENVPGAPMEHGIILCGSMFGLKVRRHRYFETSHLIFSPGPCRHTKEFYTIVGGNTIKQRSNPAYTGLRCGVGSNLIESFPTRIGKDAMGIDWMNADELSQAIPPLYTEWIGKQFLQFVF